MGKRGNKVVMEKWENAQFEVLYTIKGTVCTFKDLVMHNYNKV